MGSHTPEYQAFRCRIQNFTIAHVVMAWLCLNCHDLIRHQGTCLTFGIHGLDDSWMYCTRDINILRGVITYRGDYCLYYLFVFSPSLSVLLSLPS